MSGISKPGIAHYSMDCDHIHNKKVRLLLSEFGPAGYWVWCCLVSEGYRTNGYFFDINDSELMELFATDVCKQQVSLVEEVIRGCVRRGLFDKTVSDMFNVLTSVHQQEIYVKATKERRKKGTNVLLRADYILIEIPQNEVNITIIPKTKAILPRTDAKIPRTNPQSKVEYSKEEKKGTATPKVDSVLPGADAPAKQKNFKQWSEKDFGEELKKFTNLHPKERLRAFFDYWKEKSARGKMRCQLERTWETKNRLETWERNESIFGPKKNQSEPAKIVTNDYLLERQKAKDRIDQKHA